MNTFSIHLKELRAEKNISQRKIAKELNILQVTYCNWENNQTEPDLKSLIALCKYFEVSADYLLGLENEDGTKNTNISNSFNNFSGNGNNIKF